MTANNKKTPKLVAPPKDRTRETYQDPTKTRDMGALGLIERGGAGSGKHKNKQDYERGHARQPKHRGKVYEEAMTLPVERVASQPQVRRTPMNRSFPTLPSERSRKASTRIYPENCQKGKTYHVSFGGSGTYCKFLGWSSSDREAPEMYWLDEADDTRWEAYMFHGRMCAGSSADEIVIYSI